MSSLSTKFKVPGSAEKQKSQVIGRGYHSYHGKQVYKSSYRRATKSLHFHGDLLVSRVVSCLEWQNIGRL